MKANKVIWVDDDPIFLEYIGDSLHLVQDQCIDNNLIVDNNKLTFIFCSNVSDALMLLQHDQSMPEPQIGLMVFDQHMPDLKGLDLAKKIKKLSGLSLYRFAMCSSENDISIMAEALRLGAVQYIPKQLSAEQIYFTLQYQISQVNHISNMSDVSRRRIRRGMAAGIIALHQSENVNDIYKSMNTYAQRQGHTIDSFTEQVINLHNSVALSESALCNLLKKETGL